MSIVDFRNWKTDLDCVYPEIQRVAIGGHEVRILALSERIALGLPRDRKLASEVVSLYRPMKWKAKVVARGVKAFVGIGGYSYLKSGPIHEGEAEISWLKDASCVGFLGCNPGHGLRCVALSRNGNQPIKVTKFAIGPNVVPIVKERECLEGIFGRFPGVPKLGGGEFGENWAAFWTEYLPGTGPNELGGKEEIDLLRSWLGAGMQKLEKLSWVQPLLSECPPAVAEKLRREVIRTALVHGDFTPWNLRRDRAGLVAIDWEWARCDGLGGLDLGHGLVMEALLVDGLRGMDLINGVLLKINQGEQLGYLKECGWVDVNLWLALALLYSSKLAGLNIEVEMNILNERLEHFV